MADKTTPERSVQYEEWTPEMAERALSKNEVNRGLREGMIEKYARDMASGHWNDSAPIQFGADGRLFDGQHRLHAQIKAGVTITWLVVRGLPEEAQTTMDIGGIRTLNDHLAFMGIKYSSILAPTLRMITSVLAGKLGVGRWTPSFEEALETLNTHPEIASSAEYCSQFRGSKTMTPIAPSVMSCAHWLIAMKNDWDEADAFVQRVASLTHERPGSPVLALARRANEAKRQGLAVKPWVWLSLVIKAWNYDVDGKSVNKLALYQKGETFKLPEVKKRAVPYQAPDDLETDDEVEGEEVTVDN